MAKRLHLFNRKGVFVWRRRLPAAVARAVGQSHLTQSLRTRDPRLARVRALRLSLVFEDARATMGDDALNGYSRADIQGFLKQLRARIRAECERWVADQSVGEAGAPATDHHGLYGHPGERKRAWQAAYHRGDCAQAAEVLREIMIFLGKAPPEAAIARIAPKAMQAGIAAFAEAERDLAAGALEPYAAGIDAPPPTASPAPAPAANAPASECPQSAEVLPPHPSPRRPAVGEGALMGLRAASDAFIEQRADAEWKGKSNRDAATSQRLLLEWFGDIPVDTITRQQARAFRTALGRIPAKHGKGQFAGLPLQQAVDEADALDETAEAGGEHKRLSLKTANKHLTFAKGVLDHAMETDARLQSNPFAGLLYTKNQIAKHAEGGRQPWSDAEVRQLLTSPVWTGCASEHRRKEPGNEIVKDGAFWVPLLALYAGLRLEEACQLQVADIAQIEDHWCVCVARGAGKDVKSESARRQIPLHSTLQRLGFLEHVDAQRAAGRGERAQVFRELERGGPHRLFGYRFSKWFTDYRRAPAVNLYEPGKDFHSLRTTFSNHILRKTKADTMVAMLLGHKLQGVTHQHYFAGFSAKEMKETVELVDYGVDWNHMLEN